MAGTTQIAALTASEPITSPPAQLGLPWRLVNADELGRRVRAAVAYSGLGNAEVAKRVGIGRSTLERTMQGKRAPRNWELWAVAEVCGLPRNFFTGDWSDG